MRYPGFIGGSSEAPTLIANCERSVNLYSALVDSPAAPTSQVLRSTPGQRLFGASTDLNGRGSFAVGGRAFKVIGTSFLEVLSTGAMTVRGAVTQDGNPATLSYNGIAGGQLFITSGGNGYLYDMNTHAYSQVLTGDATMGGMLNGRFLAFSPTNGRVRFSALNNGASWDPTDYFGRSQGADPWVAMVIRTPEIWMIGETTGEVWYDTGAYPTPFAPVPGATFEFGTSAAFSVVKVGGFLLWLSQDANGGDVIVAAKGYDPQPISTLAVSHALAGYRRDSTIDDCEALVYSEDGHTFACFSFPTAGTTWCVDLTMQMAWHERGVFNPATGRYQIWGPRAHCYAFGKHLVVSRGSAVVSELTSALATELDGTGIRRLRIPPPLWATHQQRLTVDRFQVIVEPGLGAVSGQGSDPMLMLRASSDAKTWGAERTASVGALGQYGKRCVFTRCGSSDVLWVPEVAFSDPIPLRISDAEIEGTGFSTGRAA